MVLSSLLLPKARPLRVRSLSRRRSAARWAQGWCCLAPSCLYLPTPPPLNLFQENGPRFATAVAAGAVVCSLAAPSSASALDKEVDSVRCDISCGPPSPSMPTRGRRQLSPNYAPSRLRRGGGGRRRPAKALGDIGDEPPRWGGEGGRGGEGGGGGNWSLPSGGGGGGDGSLVHVVSGLCLAAALQHTVTDSQYCSRTTTVCAAS